MVLGSWRLSISSCLGNPCVFREILNIIMPSMALFGFFVLIIRLRFP